MPYTCELVHSVLGGIDGAGRHDLMEHVAAGYCEAASSWNRFLHQDMSVRWLGELRGPPADAMARAIHRSGEMAYFCGTRATSDSQILPYRGFSRPRLTNHARSRDRVPA